MPTRRRLLQVSIRGLACVFFTYHLAATTLTNLGTSTALKRRAEGWIRPYIQHLALWQEWDMFTTIPYYAELTGNVVATFPDRRVQEFPPILPGLEPAPASLKVTSLLSRIMWSKNSFESNVSRWERAMCRAIAEEVGERPSTVHLRLYTQRLNPLAQVRSTGKIAHPEQFNSRPAPCPR
jgi:hypothetical protein